jgi:hypothetical protein
MNDQPPTPLDLLRVDEILGQIATDLEIHFQTCGDEMDRAAALKHFKERRALAIVRTMVLDRGEAVAGIV